MYLLQELSWEDSAEEKKRKAEIAKMLRKGFEMPAIDDIAS